MISRIIYVLDIRRNRFLAGNNLFVTRKRDNRLNAVIFNRLVYKLKSRFFRIEISARNLIRMIAANKF